MTQSSAAGGMTAGAKSLESAQASLLQAQQDLATAEKNLAGATLISPIAGRIGTITLKAGQTSGSGSITVIGEGAATITVNVPLNVRPLIAVGASAKASVPGSTAVLSGTVTQISELSANSASGNPTYATLITVADAENVLSQGGIASVTVALGTVSNITVAPGSAVTPTGSGAGTVQVWDATAKALKSVPVKTGAVGQGFVQILDGLPNGSEVVLANRSAAVPANTNQRAGRPGATPTPTPSVSPR